MKTLWITILSFFGSALSLSAAEFVPNLEELLNQAFAIKYDLNKQERLSKEYGFNSSPAFTVSEWPTLLPTGKIPEPISLGQVIVVRKDRRSGLNELKISVKFEQERFWTYVPSANFWLYTSVEGSIANAGYNAILTQLIVDHLGAVELYHSHVDASAELNFQNAPQKRFEKIWYYLANAVPSQPDMMIALRETNSSQLIPLNRHFVIHRFGITEFKVHTVLSNGKNPRQLYPSFPSNFVDNFALPYRPKDINRSYSRILKSVEQDSLSQISRTFLTDEQIGKGQEPKVTFEFSPY